MTPDEALEHLRADPLERAVLRAARSWGVPPTRFMGRGARLDLTVTERDQAGRPVRYVDARPEWTDDDRALALAIEAYEREICDGCGFPLQDTTDPLNEGRFVATGAIRCHGCLAQATAGAVYGETDKHAHTLRIPVEFRAPVPVPQHLEDAVDRQEVTP